ncbi:sensor histidine kinase [Actinoallomurus rhizosphaericola]|uniref:sensor histidine kinase n=1 Tax=Actinoallomurus rhizosphaericola TaxID=2952536 RepID=UPI0020919E18|nr:sensor histidine kinase [Actinoallomurus rhizosphaericola]MCO5994141.1 sensor histidine kinase [Actinoallomurus rhizosphaericola]
MSIRVGGQWPARAAMLAGLAFMLWGETTHKGAAGLHGAHLRISVALAVSSAAWLGWAVLGPRGHSPALRAMIAATGLAGSVLLVLHPQPAVYWFTFWACVDAATMFPRREGVALAGGCCGVLVTGYALGCGDALATFAAVTFVAYLVGRNRRLHVDRAEQARLLAAQTRQAGEERARAAVLAERGRIARELHDVLGHSLSALALRLEAADAVLELTGDHEEARRHVGRARALARSGQEEAIAAVRTLREGEVDLPEMINGLVETFRQDTGASVRCVLSGTARPLPAEPALAVYRAVQEALTNAGKHAPGADVEVRVDYVRDELTVEVTNGPGLVPAAAAPGGGYGLTAMRERVRLAGGTVTSGSTEAGWRVRARIGL